MFAWNSIRISFTMKVLLAILLVVANQVSHTARGHSWGYEGEEGPDHWEDHYSLCGGISQSPISLKYDLLTYTTHPPWKFSEDYNQMLSAKLINNGHTVRLALGDNEATIDGGGLPYHYHPVELHLHWGGDNNRGSEHLLNGKAFPAEVHVVHYNCIFGSFDEAKSKPPKGLAVLGFFIELQDEDNPTFQKLFDKFDQIRYKGNSSDIHGVKLKDFFPDDLSLFYRYNGSLTTPPCYESVVWTIFDNKIKLSENQLNKLRELRAGEDDESGLIVDNFRPVQKKWRRRIAWNGPPLVDHGPINQIRGKRNDEL